MSAIDPKKLVTSILSLAKDVALLVGGDFAGVASALDDTRALVDSIAPALPPVDAPDLTPTDRAAAEASAQHDEDMKFPK